MITKFLSKYAFWVLQVFGWASAAALVVFAGGYSPDRSKSMEIFLPFFFSGLLSTSFLRWILKAKVSKYSWGTKKVLGILVANFVSALFLFLCAVVAGYIQTSLDVDVRNNKPDEFDNLVVVITVAIIMLTLFLLVWSTFYYGIKYLIVYNKARLERLELKNDVKKAQLNTLKGHINPKFLVKSLKSINSLMQSNVSDARNMITELSELLRYSLTKSDDAPVSISEEIEIVEKFRQIHALNSRTNFAIERHIDDRLSTTMVPPMLILNLFILGSQFSNQDAISDLKLIHEIKQVEDSLKICVSFSGDLIQGKESQIIQNSLIQRLQLLHGTAGHFKVSKNEKATNLEVVLPINVNLELENIYGIDS